MSSSAATNRADPIVSVPPSRVTGWRPVSAPSTACSCAIASGGPAILVVAPGVNSMASALIVNSRLRRFTPVVPWARPSGPNVIAAARSSATGEPASSTRRQVRPMTPPSGSVGSVTPGTYPSGAPVQATSERPIAASSARMAAAADSNSWGGIDRAALANDSCAIESVGITWTCSVRHLVAGDDHADPRGIGTPRAGRPRSRV